MNDISLHNKLMRGGAYDELFHYVYPMEEGETLEEYVDRRIQEQKEDTENLIRKD